jgi:hypothetical protein
MDHGVAASLRVQLARRMTTLTAATQAGNTRISNSV